MNSFDPFSRQNPKRPWVPPEFATPEGIVGVGGTLRTSTLLLAYSSGVFPWFNEDDPIIWWSPDPRAVIELNDYHVSKKLAAKMRKNPFRITVNVAFPEVIRACGQNRDEGTWLTEEMIDAYCTFHRKGHAHSLETWLGDELVGGIYGVAIGAMFAGESMFHRVTDASKVALVSLLELLRSRGFRLFDTQIINNHTRQFGAKEIPRYEYLDRLRSAIAVEGVGFV